MEGYPLLTFFICMGLTSAYTNFDLRLAGKSSTSSQGRVEVFYNGVWGTVCDDNWGRPDADVVCKQLGFPGASGFTRRARTFGPGSGPIHLDNVKCSGDESSISDCNMNAIGDEDCGHAEDAGVICEAVVRLGGNSRPNVGWGVVEVFKNGEWGRLCNAGWTQQDANVICKQLGFSDTAYYFFTFTQFCGEGTGSFMLSGVTCTGTETSILDCPASSAMDCPGGENAEVLCQRAVSSRSMDVGLYRKENDMTQERTEVAAAEKVLQENGSEELDYKKDTNLKEREFLEGLADLLAKLRRK